MNYRGSTGLGQDSIDSLPGKDGTQDVGDVHVSYIVVVAVAVVIKLLDTGCSPFSGGKRDCQQECCSCLWYISWRIFDNSISCAISSKLANSLLE